GRPSSIPEIRVKSPASRDAHADAGGSVSPSNHAQSADHLQVPSASKPHAQNKQQKQQQQQRTVQPGSAGGGGGGGKRTFLARVDRALGLHHVRTYGDREPLVDGRYRAKRNTLRAVALFGVLMMVSLAASVALFIYFASKGGAGPEWFAWIAISAAGWIWSLLAFIMAKQSQRRVLQDVEASQESIRLDGRGRRDGTAAAPVAVASGPGANGQQTTRAGSGAGVAAGGAALPVRGKHPGLEPICKEDWARNAEECLDMPATGERPPSGDA
ncbi:hypothetical protein LX36DRAFT_532910, partial [Colletotrichum falcatum]